VVDPDQKTEKDEDGKMRIEEIVVNGKGINIIFSKG